MNGTGREPVMGQGPRGMGMGKASANAADCSGSTNNSGLKGIEACSFVADSGGDFNVLRSFAKYLGGCFIGFFFAILIREFVIYGVGKPRVDTYLILGSIESAINTIFTIPIYVLCAFVSLYIGRILGSLIFFLLQFISLWLFVFSVFSTSSVKYRGVWLWIDGEITFYGILFESIVNFLFSIVPCAVFYLTQYRASNNEKSGG